MSGKTKFHLFAVSMMEELKFTGNCLKSSRPVLSFDHVRNRNIVKLSEVFLAT